MKKLIVLILLISVKAEAQTSALRIADSLFQIGHYSKAIKVYSGIGDQSQVYHKVAKAYVALGNYQEALKNYKYGVDSNGDNAIIKYDYAKLLSKSKQFDKAKAVLNELLETDSLNSNFHYETGLVKEQLKDSTAYKDFEKAFQLDPAHQKAIFKLAKRQLAKRNHDKVEELVRLGLQSYQNNKELISIRAQNYYWLREYENAKIWFEKLLELKENSQFIHEKLSFCYRQLSDYQKAIYHQKLALKFEPNNAAYLFTLGRLYDDLHEFEEAEANYKTAIKLWNEPLDKEYIKLATVLNMQQKHKEALQAFNKAQKENPDNPNIDLLILLTLEKMTNDYDAKIKLYEDYLNKFPETQYKKIFEYKISSLKEEQFTKED